jgi:hypothetical protein
VGRIQGGFDGVLEEHTWEANQVTHYVNAAQDACLQTCATLANQILILRASSNPKIIQKYCVLAELFTVEVWGTNAKVALD